MENPYSPPSSSAKSNGEFSQKYDSAVHAAREGNKVAVRLITRLFAVIGILLVLTFIGILFYNGFTFGRWPAIDAPQFWLSTLLAILTYLGIYFVACLLGCFFSSMLFRYLYAASKT